MFWRLTLPRKTWCGPNLIRITVSFCPHSQAGSRNQSCAGFLYVREVQRRLSGLLHAHSLKYLLSGKTNASFGPELFLDLKVQQVTLDALGKGHAGGVGAVSRRHPLFWGSQRGELLVGTWPRVKIYLLRFSLGLSVPARFPLVWSSCIDPVVKENELEEDIKTR